MKKLSCILFLFLSFQLAAQQPLRVGVVLSGGGAKGVAHVGALRVLEEAGIRIDYIGGTSMGGIIGGLYAAGWSVDQLDSILRTNDLAVVLQDEVLRRYQPFFGKQYGEKYAFRLSFKDFKLALPSALSEGQQAFDFMSALTRHVYQITDFSQLPTPFFCVGTDVSTGEQVVLERGCLAQAMRASGSFPGLLAPVEVDGRLITDGGVVNDFPAREVREKGMDIVIGINVESKLYGKDELLSMEKIIEQIGSYQMIARSREQTEYCDLLILPDIEGYSVTSFEAVDTLIARGDQAVRQYWDQLTGIARRQQALPQPVRIAVDPLATAVEPMQISSVQLAETPAMKYRTMLRKFPEPLPGPITFEKFREGIAALYATDNFRYIDYHFEPAPDSGQTLFLKLYTKPGYESSLRMGLHYDQVYKSSLLLNGTFRNLLFEGTILSVDCIVGDKLRYNLHYFVENSKWPGFGINSRLNLVDLPVDLPVQIDIGGNISVQNLLFKLADFTQEAYVNLASNNQFALGLAAEVKFFKTSTDQAVNYLTEEKYIDEKGWYASGKFFFRFDSRDRIFFTRRGLLAGLTLRATQPIQSLKYEDQTDKLGWNFDLRTELSRPIGSHLVARLNLDAGNTRGVSAPPFRYFLGSINRNLINNFRPFPGLPFAKVSGDNLLKTSLTLQYHLFKSHFLSIGGHLASLSDSQTPFSRSADILRSLSISYGIDTFLGPVEVTYAYSNMGGELYFNVGFWF
ncbi:MAG: patatin-like phospholipase family protein [Lewinellaceae bacterium]|nr:patatin-like phospholipase family protein [Lewinellaceae bacterium]